MNATLIVVALNRVSGESSAKIVAACLFNCKRKRKRGEFCLLHTPNLCCYFISLFDAQKVGKKMKIDYLKQKLLHKHKALLLQFLVAAFFFGLAFRLLLFHPSEISPVLESSFLQKSAVPESPFPDNATVPEPANATHLESSVSTKVDENADQLSHSGYQMPHSDKCDLFTGNWIPNPLGPVYTNESCNHIEDHQNCLRNGRPDSGYLYWRWSPRQCELPQFDPKRFLNMMRNKAWALIGDSISRNHVQSLLCILSTVEQAVMVYHDEDYRSKKWHFPSYNFSMSVIWSPFLVEAAIFEDQNGVSASEVQLHLDRLGNWTNQYQNLDYMIFSTGKWFLKSSIYYENGAVLGCHYCPKRNLTELGFNFAYRKALRSVLNFIVSSNHGGLIFFRTSTPDHFENGEWFSGGTCNRTGPVREGEMEMKSVNQMLRNIELEEFAKAATEASTNRVNLKLLDFVPLSLMRPDGHPGPYRDFHPFAKGKNAKVQNDCLHWCLPGPIDSWNDIIMEMILNG